MREGHTELPMIGSLHTDELVAAIIRSGTGQHTKRRISHCFILDVPNLHRAIIITDAAINIFPTMEDKMPIIQNAIDLDAAKIKKIESPVAGRADILVAPDLEAGNALAKSLSLIADAYAALVAANRRNRAGKAVTD